MIDAGTAPPIAAGTRRTAPPRRLRWRVGRLRDAAIAAAILALGAVLPAARPLPFDLCLWHRLTGFDCLGCGLTRSVCHVMQGDPAGAVALHPAGPLVVGLLAGVVVVRIAEALRADPLL